MDSSRRGRIGLLFQVFRTSQLTGRLVSRALDGTGMRPDDYAVYSYLLRGPMTLTELAQGTGLPLTTAAGYVSRFAERGHVEKRPNPADGRSRLIALTDEARAWVLECARVFTATVDRFDEVMNGMGLDPDAFDRQLERVQESIEATLARLDDAGDRDAAGRR